MMITRDDPRLPRRSGRPLPAVSGPPAGDRTVLVQLTCQRGRWRLSQLDPASWVCLLSAVCRVSSSRRCLTRVFAISGCMMTPRACLRTADKLYLDFILVKIYLEIDVRIRTRTLGAGCVGTRRELRLGVSDLRSSVCGVLGFPATAKGPPGLVYVYSAWPLCRGGLTFSADVSRPG